MEMYRNPWGGNQDPPSALAFGRTPVLARTPDVPVVEGLRTSMFDSRNTGRWSDRDGERVFAPVAGGFELNASSNKELIGLIGQILRMGAAGQYKRGYAGLGEERRAAMETERREVLAEAIADKSGEKMQRLGEIVGDEIWLTMKRDGFARRLMILKDVQRGQEAKLRVRRRDATAYLLAEGNVPVSRIKVPYVYPDQYKLSTTIKIDSGEISRTDADILEEKYQDGIEAIMVREDQKWKTLADAAASAVNDLVYFDTFTPTAFATLKNQITGWGLPVQNCVLAYDLWDDIIAATDFSGWFDPVHKHELILEGQLGSILDVNIITDAIREPKQKVIDAGTCYFVSSPLNHGGICQWKALEMHAINFRNQGDGSLGWFGELLEGMALVSARSVTKGIRNS